MKATSGQKVTCGKYLQIYFLTKITLIKQSHITAYPVQPPAIVVQPLFFGDS